MGSFTPPHLVSPAAVARNSRLPPQHLLLLLRSFPSSAPSPPSSTSSFFPYFSNSIVTDRYFDSRYRVDIRNFVLEIPEDEKNGRVGNLSDY